MARSPESSEGYGGNIAPARGSHGEACVKLPSGFHRLLAVK